MGPPKSKSISAIGNRKFIDKSKSTGDFIVFKQKKTVNEKVRRQRLDSSSDQLTDSQRAQSLRKSRLKNLVRVQKQRERKRQLDRKQKVTSLSVRVKNARAKFVENRNEDTSADNDSDSGFDNEEELDEAVARMERALPSSPRLRKAVIIELFRRLDEQSQREIIESWQQREGNQIALNGQ